MSIETISEMLKRFPTVGDNEAVLKFFFQYHSELHCYLSQLIDGKRKFEAGYQFIKSPIVQQTIEPELEKLLEHIKIINNKMEVLK